MSPFPSTIFSLQFILDIINSGIGRYGGYKFANSTVTDICFKPVTVTDICFKPVK